MTPVPTDMTHWDGCEKVHPGCACPIVWELPGRWAPHPHHCSERLGHAAHHRCICGARTDGVEGRAKLRETPAHSDGEAGA